MFSFICKKLLLRQNPRICDACPSRLLLLQLHIGRNTSPAAAHYLSTESENEDGGKGSLLSCSPVESRNRRSSSSSSVDAGLATDNIEVTKTLLRGYGFTDAQISKLYHCRPSLFNSAHLEKTTLLHNLDFYRGTIGFSNTDLPRFICCNPSLLDSSLQNQIVPVYNFIKDLLSSSDDSDSDDDEVVLLKTLQRGPRLLTYTLERRIVPNIAALRAAGVPHKHILLLLRWAPTVLGSLSLGESIKRTAEMGFHPNKLSFLEAIRMFTELSKSTRDKKMEVFRKCGWSDGDILKAFRSKPKIMSLSEGKIEKTMDFVVNKMGRHPAYLARDPALLIYSLEKRIIPRCTVVKYLQGKGLLRKNVSLRAILRPMEKVFIDKFVNTYEIDVPDLMDIYLGKKFSPLSDKTN